MTSTPALDLLPVDALFDVPAVPERPRLSATSRRTLRRLQALKLGQHPMSIAIDMPLRLHPEAAPADDRHAPGRRCGNCIHRVLHRHHNRPYAKCVAAGDDRVTHGPGTDVRAWWPACPDHTAVIA